MAATEREKYAALLRQAEGEITGRWGEGRINPTRERITALVDLLGEPQRAYRSIHVTGTNGKTTTARMIDELLRGFGLRTGRFTSPHLSAITERIALDGHPVSDRTFVEAYAELVPYLELVDGRVSQGSLRPERGPEGSLRPERGPEGSLRPEREPEGSLRPEHSPVRMSFFEVITAMAYAIFADAPVDVAIVEVGMGGEWDATNVIDAEIAVVTPIGVDHVQYLGYDVASIAREKAGIIKAGASAILAAQPVRAAEELIRRSVAVRARVAREGLEFGVLDRRVAVGGQLLTLQGLAGGYDEIFLPLHGAHQAQNAACALAAAEAFFGVGPASGRIDVDIVRTAFAAVRSPGRLETVRSAPTVLVDAAHNPAGMSASVDAISEAFDFRRLVGVVAVLGEKDVRGMLRLLEPILDEVVVTQNGDRRALPVDELAEVAVEFFGPDRVTVEPHLDDAIETAVRLSEQNDDDLLSGAGVLITGSVVTAGEARLLLGAR